MEHVIRESPIQGIKPNPDTGLQFILHLGSDYERKKEKLKQELRRDYKQHVAKQKHLKTSAPHPQPQGLSLPLDNRRADKERLREERNKEYNLFLQEKAHIRRLKRRTPSVDSKAGHVPSSDAGHIFTPASPRPITPAPHMVHPASRRDAATLTEDVDHGKSTGTEDLPQRRRRRWRVYRQLEPCSSEEDLITDKEEELEFGQRRRKNIHSPELRMRQYRADRTPLDVKQMEPSVHDQDNKPYNSGLKSDLQTPGDMMASARLRPGTSKDKAEISTGLRIGAEEDSAAAQMRKEKYRQELLEQIDTKRKNKLKEKHLEVRAAATGTTDPEQQFRGVSWQQHSRRPDVHHVGGIDGRVTEKEPKTEPKETNPAEHTEQRGPAGESQVESERNTVSGMGAGQSDPSPDSFHENFHRDYANVLGEVAIPRVAGVPPPRPPAITNDYSTPYDAAYYYYGTRNPLDPNLHHNQNGLAGWVQQSGNPQSPPEKPPPPGPSHHTRSPTQEHRASSLLLGNHAVDEARQRRETTLNYQEALRQQIKEREERKRREKEERERYDAKMEAEGAAYNPWGRSGGGAPNKDPHGNLLSDLNEMHTMNRESCRTPAFRNRQQAHDIPMWNADSRGAEDRTTSHPSAFKDQSTPQQLDTQDRYKEALKQQIEEKKKKEAEERERVRVEEEREERRLAEQRARIQQEYEEERLKSRMMELKNQSLISLPKADLQKEKETVKDVPQSTSDSEKKKMSISYERATPPPRVPARQKTQMKFEASRDPSDLNQLSSMTEQTVSAPAPAPEEFPRSHGETVPASLTDCRPPLPAAPGDQREVMRQLSALRRFLREEQTQLEARMNRTDQEESRYTLSSRPRRRPTVEASDSARKEADQPSTARTYSIAPRANVQNIMDFNHLKYRDTASREELLHMYPDPPADAQSLDIQQQALLREQRRKLRLMKREDDRDYLDPHLNHYYSRQKPGGFHHRDSILPSEMVLMDVYSGDECEERVDKRRSRQPSAEHVERTSTRRRHDSDISMTQRDGDIQPDTQSLQSSTGLDREPKVKGHSQWLSGEHTTTERLVDGEEDDLSLSSVLERRVSVETIATEPWLRPGTSAAVRQRTHGRMEAPSWRTRRAT